MADILLSCLKKRLISGCLLFVMVGFCFSFVTFAMALSLDEAEVYAQNLSTKFKNKKFALATKKIQLQQAKEAVSDARKNESTVRFSLPFNIQFPEKYALPKEVELLTKVPEIEAELKTINKELEDIKLTEQQNVREQFLSVYESEQKYKLAQEVLDELVEKLSKTKINFAKGLANAKDVQTLETKIKSQESKVSGLLVNLERYREKLSEIIGFNVSDKYILKSPFKKTDIDRSYLDSIVAFTVNNDFGLYNAQQQENTARQKADQIYGVFGDKYGNVIKKIEAEARKNTGMDYDEFLTKYNSLLVDVDKPWVGNYTFSLLLFKLDVPKEWLKGEHDGTRYLEDQKYALFLAVKDKEDAMNNTLSVRKELIANVKDGFETLKSMWKTYNSSVMLTKQAKKEYDRVFLLNKQGKASFDEVEAEKSNWESAQETELSNIVSYNKQLVSYNKLTCGSIDAMTKDIDIFLKAAQSGDSMAEYDEIVEDQEDAIVYYINTAVDQRRAVFGLQPLRGYKNEITHYELLTSDGLVVAKKTEINKQISVLPIEYQGSTEMKVRLYNNDEFVDEAVFDAIVGRGKLKLSNLSTGTKTGLISDNIKLEDKVCGSYEMTTFVGNMVKKIKFNISDAQGASFYKIVDRNDMEVGRTNKYYLLKDTFSCLGFVFNDLSELKINFYDANHNFKFVAKFDEANHQIVVVND